MSIDCFAHAASITIRTTVRLRHFGVPLSMVVFSFTAILDILDTCGCFPHLSYPSYVSYLSYVSYVSYVSYPSYVFCSRWQRDTAPNFGQPLRYFGVPLSIDCFAHAASITRRTTVRLRHFGVSLNTTIFGFTTILDILDNPVQNHFDCLTIHQSPVTFFPFWTSAKLILDTAVQSRAVLPKPPHEPVSAKLAYLKLRPLPPLRHFGVSLNTTIFGFTTILDNLDNPVQNHFRLSYYSPVTLFRFLYDFQTTSWTTG